MITIDNSIKDKQKLENAVKRFREQKIILPTIAQQMNPDLIPEKIKSKLKDIGLWDLNSLNLFRITWKNEPVKHGGGFSDVNYIEIPNEITGVKAKIIMLVGKWFPTGAHKVGAAYGCLAPRIITGDFDPITQKAVWPSTGNYCRGGAFDSYLMASTSVAILPEEMSAERFEWLKKIGAEIIATKGCESNVKEIYDACWDIRKNRPDCVIFNQFDEFGNSIWHYNVTGSAIEEVYNKIKTSKSQLAGFTSATGSAGTIAAGDYLKNVNPLIKVGASEALQCPTLLLNGFGGHRIEGIGDKHIPWIHNAKNTDCVLAIDDEDCIRLMRLFNEPVGKNYLKNICKDENFINNIDLLGISSISNLLGAVKMAKYYEMTSDDVIFTVATDSMELYNSRMIEYSEKYGKYSELQAARDFEGCMVEQSIDYLKELSYYDKKAIHNLKYFTWVEQQAKDVEDLNQLWEDRDLFPKMFNQIDEWDNLINEFNERTGLLNEL
jgi:cysteine synthase